MNREWGTMKSLFSFWIIIIIIIMFQKLSWNVLIGLHIEIDFLESAPLLYPCTYLKVGGILHLSPLCVQKKNMATNGGLKRKSPPDVPNDIIFMDLSIRFQDGRRLFFKVNQDLELSRVFRDFCDRKKLEYETLQFIYEGSHINGRQTPKMLNMENGAEIFAARHQLGGGGVVAL
ncbi:Small ubiquitin-related modifier 2 [Spatholobus suberectus]|nr:Small ubiquitin-related modifier 2 [Spatholobus suberectus]